MDLLGRHLLDTHARGRRVVLIVDEAQNLSTETLEQVRLLTNLETATTKLLQIILIGQPELRALLDQPELRQLAQRITGRYHLSPLSTEETRGLREAPHARRGRDGRGVHAGGAARDPPPERRHPARDQRDLRPRAARRLHAGRPSRRRRRSCARRPPRSTAGRCRRRGSSGRRRGAIAAALGARRRSAPGRTCERATAKRRAQRLRRRGSRGRPPAAAAAGGRTGVDAPQRPQPPPRRAATSCRSTSCWCSTATTPRPRPRSASCSRCGARSYDAGARPRLRPGHAAGPRVPVPEGLVGAAAHAQPPGDPHAHRRRRPHATRWC